MKLWAPNLLHSVRIIQLSAQTGIRQHDGPRHGPSIIYELHRKQPGDNREALAIQGLTPPQLKRSERGASKGHCGPRWYGAAGKHSLQCSIFRGAAPESISPENSVVNNIIDSVYSGDVKWERWCITHPSTLQLSPVNEQRGGSFFNFLLQKNPLRTNQLQRVKSAHKWEETDHYSYSYLHSEEASKAVKWNQKNDNMWITVK